MSSTYNKNDVIEKSINEFKKTIIKDPFKQYLDKNMAEDEDKQILFCVDALYQGYLDACRTFQGQEKINRIKVENKKPVKTENNKLWSIAVDIYKYLCDGNVDEFDEQHHNWCKYFMEYQGMKYGQAQKIVNMAFKYMYCIWYGKEEYKKYLKKCTPCHMPLDSFSLEWINRCYIKGKDLKKHKKLFDDSVWDKRSLNKKDGAKYVIKQDGPIGSWSQLEYGEKKSKKCTYKFYVDLLHDELGKDVSPLWVDFYVWPRMQMILSAEAFIKTFKDEENHTEDSDNSNNENSQNDEYINEYALENLDATVLEKLQQVKQITESAMARICQKDRRKRMNVEIYSRSAIEMLLKKGFPKNTAVISFYDPLGKFHDENYCPVDYKGKTAHLFQVAVHDIDLSVLPEYGLNYNTYFTEASALAEFIFEAHQDGLDIICQCEYGESRSSGCAAAILEYFYQEGLSIFTDYRYYPNQVIYHKVFDALNEIKRKKQNKEKSE